MEDGEGGGGGRDHIMDRQPQPHPQALPSSSMLHAGKGLGTRLGKPSIIVEGALTCVSGV